MHFFPWRNGGRRDGRGRVFMLSDGFESRRQMFRGFEDRVLGRLLEEARGLQLAGLEPGMLQRIEPCTITN